MRRVRIAGAALAALLWLATPGGAYPLAGVFVPAGQPVGPLAGAALERVAACARLIGYLRWFHPADEAVACRWSAFAAEALAEAERGPDQAGWLPRLQARVARVAPSAQVWARGPAPVAPAFARPPGAEPLVAVWRHRGHGGGRGSTFGSTRAELALTDGRLSADLPVPGTAYEADLGAGLACRVPLALWADGSGTWPKAAPVAGPPPREPAARATRLAAVATLWAGFQHFHPRLDRDGWARALGPALSEAAGATHPDAMHRVLRKLAARVGDGQLRFRAAGLTPKALPPIACTWAEGRLLVEAVDGGARGVKPGDELISVDGAEAWGLLADEMLLTSGATAARQRLIASKTMLFGLPGSKLDLRFGRPDGSTYAVTVKRERPGTALPRPPRPPVAERVAGGVWYVDLTRVNAQGWQRLQPLLAPASGVVFDLRGPAGGRPLPAVLGALATAPLRTARFFVPGPDRPDQARPPRSHVTYTIPPALRPLAAKVAFLCDARTLGDGEIALALVKAAGLGAIVGEASAGTAGATDQLVLPGGHQVGYTGVAAHEQDGAPLGPVQPTVWVPVTRAGLVAGRDEALERAIALVAGTGLPPRPRKRARLAAADISQP